MQPSEPRTGWRKWLTWPFRIFVIMTVLLVMALLVGMVMIPMFLGLKPITVLTGSMDPSIPPGSQVYVKPLENTKDVEKSVHSGDVITFMPNPNDDMLVTHRVVSVGWDATEGLMLSTKGDNNRSQDPDPVYAKQVRGIVRYHIPVVGRLALLLEPGQKRIGIFVIVGLLVTYALYQVARAFFGKPKPHQKENDPDPGKVLQNESLLPTVHISEDSGNNYPKHAQKPNRDSR